MARKIRGAAAIDTRIAGLIAVNLASSLPVRARIQVSGNPADPPYPVWQGENPTSQSLRRGEIEQIAKQSTQ